MYTDATAGSSDGETYTGFCECDVCVWSDADGDEWDYQWICQILRANHLLFPEGTHFLKNKQLIRHAEYDWSSVIMFWD